MDIRPEFSVPNLTRIYAGLPVRINNKSAYEIFSNAPLTLEAAQLASEGHTYTQIAELQDTPIGNVQSRLHCIYGKLGVYGKVYLPAFFPINPDDTVLEDRSLSQLTPAQLEVVERLSRGIVGKLIALDMGTSQSTIRTHVHGISKRWPDVDSQTKAVRLSNGLRAKHVKHMLFDREIAPSEILSQTLPVIAKSEEEANQ